MTQDRNPEFPFTLSRRAALKATAGAAASAAWSTAFLRSIQVAGAQDAAGGQLIIGKPYEAVGLDPHFQAS